MDNNQAKVEGGRGLGASVTVYDTQGNETIQSVDGGYDLAGIVTATPAEVDGRSGYTTISVERNDGTSSNYTMSNDDAADVLRSQAYAVDSPNNAADLVDYIQNPSAPVQVAAESDPLENEAYDVGAAALQAALDDKLDINFPQELVDALPDGDLVETIENLIERQQNPNETLNPAEIKILEYAATFRDGNEAVIDAVQEDMRAAPANDDVGAYVKTDFVIEDGIVPASDLSDILDGEETFTKCGAGQSEAGLFADTVAKCPVVDAGGNFQVSTVDFETGEQGPTSSIDDVIGKLQNQDNMPSQEADSTLTRSVMAP